MFSDEAEALASKLGLRFYRTSVKEGFHVNEGSNFVFILFTDYCLVFDYLAEQYIKNKKTGTATQVGIGNMNFDEGKKEVSSNEPSSTDGKLFLFNCSVLNLLFR